MFYVFTDIIDKTGTILKLIQTLLQSLCDSVIETCNAISKNYRMVADELEEEIKHARHKIRVQLVHVLQCLHLYDK